jgi:ribosome-associated protein
LKKWRIIIPTGRFASIPRSSKDKAFSMQQQDSIPDLSSEFQFITSRSSGPGGQNVNKVNSKVELRFNIPQSVLLSEDQKGIILTKLSSKINSEGIFIVSSHVDRSQIVNKEDAIRKFYLLIRKSLKPVRKRKPTQPTKSSIERRLTEKKNKSEIKQNRHRIE